MTVRHLNSLTSRFAFVQVSSFLMLMGINLSFFFFAHLLLSVAGSKPGRLFRANNLLRIFVLLFMLGATLSTFHNLWEGNETALVYSLAVFPNYMFWGLILLLFTALAPVRALDYGRICKAISIAVMFVSVYYLFGQGLISDKLFFKDFGPNNFAFLIICFSPYLIYFLRQRVHPLAALFVLGLLLLLQLKEGRRAGFGLVMIGGMSAFLVPWFKFNSVGRLIRPAALMLLGWGLLLTEVVETQIRFRSERIHSLIYTSTGELLSVDRSFLIRRAMVEKGFVLFQRDYLFGAGLNNFTQVEGLIEGGFEGAEYVVNKDIYSNISSHNSYINILAEGGLCLTVPFAGIMGILLFGGLRRFGSFEEFEKVVFFSFCAMSVHLYFTNGIANSMAWFNIAMLSYVVLLPREAAAGGKVPAITSGIRDGEADLGRAGRVAARAADAGDVGRGGSVRPR
jgi:hypothetical protein